MDSKEIVVYIQGSSYKYPRLFVDFLYEVDESDHLTIYERNQRTGEESRVACFRGWDYYMINSIPNNSSFL